MSYPGGPGDPNAPPPPPTPPSPTYPPPGPVRYAPVGASSYPPPPAVSSGPKWPQGLDIGNFVIGIGALLTFIGFLFGDGFAINAFSNPPNTTNSQGDLETFFVVTGFGILLIVGGWFWRVFMVARRGRP